MRPRGEATRRFVSYLLKVVVLAVTTTPSLAFAQDWTPYEGESYEDYRQRLFDEAIQPTEDNRNAGLIYQQAFREMVLVEEELREYWHQVYDQVESAPGPDTYRTAAITELLDRSSHILELAHRAANLEHAEFGINRDHGFLTLLPHLSSMRSLADLMRVQGYAQRANGQTEAASQTMADILRLSRHTSSDGVLIGALVGTHCAQDAFDSIDDAIARGELDASNAQTVLNGLDADINDPYAFVDSIQSEFDMLLTTVDSFDDPGPQLADLLNTSFMSEDFDGNEIAMLEDVDPDGINALVEQMRPGYDLAMHAFMEKDPDKARALVAEVDSALANGEYGPLANLIMPSFGAALEAKIAAENRISEYERTLRAIASGEDPAKFANAAILYAQAFPYLARISMREQEMLDLIRRVVAVTGSCDALPETMLDEVRASLEQASSVISLLQTAARFEKCEWDEAVFSERRGRIIAEGEWVRPMRAAVRLLLADAALLICLAQAEGADVGRALTRSLADALAVAIHLGDGSHLLAATASSASIAEVADLMSTVQKTNTLDSSTTDILERRFARIDSSDPLNWDAARKAMLRPPLHKIVMRYGTRNLIDAEQLVRNWSGDRLAALAFFQQQESGETENRTPSFPKHLPKGELFEITDIVELTPEDLQQLNAPHTRLIELLNAIDTVRPIDTTGWQARGGDALARLSDTIGKLEKVSPASE